MAVIPDKPRLTRQVQCRFTDEQFELLDDLRSQLGRPIGALIRDLVTVWALNHRDRKGGVDVAAMVAELQALEDES